MSPWWFIPWIQTWDFSVFWESPWMSKSLFMYMQNKPIPLENCCILMWRFKISFFIYKINEFKSCQQAFKLLKSKWEWSNSIAELSLKKKGAKLKAQNFYVFHWLSARMEACLTAFRDQLICDNFLIPNTIEIMANFHWFFKKNPTI